MNNTYGANKYWLEFCVDCTLLNRDSIKFNLSSFWKSIMSYLEKDQLVFLIVKVRFTDGSYASLSHMQTINKNMFSKLLKILYKFLDFNSDNYTDRTISSLIFQYHIKTIEKSKGQEAKLTESYKTRKVPSFRFAGYNLPISTDLETWGIVNELDNNLFKVTHNSREYKVHKFIDKQVVDIMSDVTVLDSFTDIFGESSTSFTRIFKNKEFIYKNGDLIIKKLNRKTDFITKIKADKNLNDRFLTLDIETKTIDNVMVPYCLSIYDGYKFKSFYLTNYSNSDDMLTSAISYLLKRSYDGYKVYIHNLSHFDGIFLFKILSNYKGGILTPVMKDGKMISLRFSWKPTNFSIKTYSIEFRDSLLMLPISLMKLSKAFNVESKGLFPYSFVNKNKVDLNYEGLVPEFQYFDRNIKFAEYNTYKNTYKTKWNLKTESIKYCELDCKVLYDIIKKFNELVFNKYQLNIHRFPTLPSLTFGIFRAHYLIENTIPKISGQMYFDIKEGYTGGHTDMYVPFGQNVGCYDINSLFPSSMNSFPMPTGSITFFEGNILDFLSQPFGFFECEIKTPENMDRPLLQTKVKTSAGLRTVAPLGQWTDMIFSEEMFEYMKYGYTFKILRGYLFDKEFIFESYVQDLFKIKKNESKDSPMYLISKLLLNSLYGRFGMSPYLVEHDIIDNSSLDSLTTNKNVEVLECLDLKNGKTLISFQTLTDDKPIVNSINVNISIAAAVTSYARIHMSEFLGNTNLRILYTDTDSIYIEGDLDYKYIGKGLGLMKLEYRFKECVFLAPKVYGGILENGSELTKVKGLKHAVNYQELKSLLIKDNKLELNQDKWFKSISDGKIIIKNDLYTLIATESKRSLIYENSLLFSSKPITINKDKIY